MAQDLLEKTFLAELEALEKFRISYTGLHRNTPLSREDPDVRRLIEAMAMFTARTKLAGHRSIDQSLLRIFRQHFPYLLDPAPAMTMLRAEPSARYVDVTELPRGTEVYLVENADKKSKQRVFRFRTLSKLRILPIEIEDINIFKTRTRTFRLIVKFSSAFKRNDEIGDIDLYVNHLDDLPSSLTVLYAFKQHLKSASVVFDKEIIEEDTHGAPCQVSFGMPEGTRTELERLDHPLLRARSFVHYPRQELYINVKGIRAPRNWQRFTVVFDLKDTWPTELALTKDAFNLHVVPMVNLRQEMADPIETDGTKERHPVMHPDHGAGFVFQRLVAVYKMTDKGLVPLEPAIIGSTRESYDIDYEGEDETRRALLMLNLPQAFEKKYLAPKDEAQGKDKKKKSSFQVPEVPGDEPGKPAGKGERVAVEALWYQPGMRGKLQSDFTAKLADRFVDGVKWAIGGPLATPGETELSGDRDGLLQLLSIKNQRFLGTDDLLFLLGALGVRSEPFFASVVRALSYVNVVSKPLAKGSHGFKYIYELTFGELDTTDLPRLDLFCGKLLEVLIAWSVEEVVEITAIVKNLDRTLQYA